MDSFIFYSVVCWSKEDRVLSSNTFDTYSEAMCFYVNCKKKLDVCEDIVLYENVVNAIERNKK